MYSPEGFRQFCYDATKQFLQSVVVIDNEAVYERAVEGVPGEKMNIPEVQEPPKGSLAGLAGGASGKAKADAQPEEQPDAAPTEALIQQYTKEEEYTHVLEAKVLIDCFADDGIICSVIRPDEDENQIVARAVKVASSADIIVVDWILGQGDGESPSLRARDIVKGIIESDFKRRGRLRLIAIYTAESNPADVLDQLFDHIKHLEFSHGCVEKIDKQLSIQNSHLKIVVRNKPSVGESVGTRPIDFKDLPAELLNLFCELNMGLLPTVALRSIAAIREETHHLLAVLHGGLDPALVGHRCLLPDPKNAEEFCDDLIAGELRSVLAMKKIGATYCDDVANKFWVGSKIQRDTPHKYKSFRLTREQAFSLLERGQKVHAKVMNEMRIDWLKQKLTADPGHKDKDGAEINTENAERRIRDEGGSAAKHFGVPDISERSLPQVFEGEDKNGEIINLEFSRLCSLKREAFGLRKPTSGWIPRLTLGTILQKKGNGGEKDEFYLCLQPRCDSVRFDKDEIVNFPFLKLKNSSGKLNIVLKAFDGSNNAVDKKLSYEAKPRNQVSFEFKSVSGEVVEALENDGIFIFKSLKNEQENEGFLWVADMKDFIAQRIADELSARVGSVGIDEYEWLRRKG